MHLSISAFLALTRSAADAYAKSFACPQVNPVCPMVLRDDTRVPRCSPSLHQCEMVGRGVFVK